MKSELDIGERKKKRVRKAGFYFKAWNRFKKNKLSLIGASIFFFFLFLAVACPYLPIQDPYKQNWGDEIVAPNLRYRLGTDNLGRDLLSRIVWGSRTSLTVGFVAVSLMTIIGIIIGGISGYYGGIIDNITMRSTEVFLSLPRLVLLIVIASIIRIKSVYFTGIIIGITDWPAMTRVVRSRFLSLKEETFVESAKSMGASDLSIIFGHLLPNSLSPVIVIATIRVGYAILTEAGLSFLGLGDPFIISWGQMLSFGASTLRIAPWRAVFPGLAIFFSTLAFNLLGDGLRDAFDVRT